MPGQIVEERNNRLSERGGSHGDILLVQKAPQITVFCRIP